MRVVLHLELTLAFFRAEPPSADMPVDPECRYKASTDHQHLLEDHRVHGLCFHGIISRLKTLGMPVLQVLNCQLAQKL